MFKKTLLAALLVSASLVMVGCASTGDKGESATSASVSDATGSGAGHHGGFDEAHMKGLLSHTTFYFDFDKSEIKPEALRSIEAHGQHLAKNSHLKVRVEGHTDERGSREYNVGLGERRAQAVARVLMMQGATHHQIHTVSYGQEKPAVQGHTEAAWAKNRRAVIVYEAG